MQIGFLYTEEDMRCPLSIKTIKKYEEHFSEIFVEKPAFEAIGLEPVSDKIRFSDRSTILQNADMIYSHLPVEEQELEKVKKGAVLISFYNTFRPEAQVYSGNYDIQAFSMDMIPRTTLAQSMDVLSSMASIAGYKAVLLGAMELPGYFPMMMTAAGTIKPSTVLVIGAGVAGLQAIATARRLGAKVEAFDVRRAVKEEVESLGAKFVEVEGSKDDKDAGGYAVEQTEEYLRKQKEKIHERVQNADVVVTTAQLRGRPAPTLITREMVEDMKFGSVIIDMASSSGGNCEVSVDGQKIIHQGVTVIGNSVLANEALIDASDLLSNNIYNYLAIFLKDGQIHVDMDNEIIAKSKMYPK